MPTTIIHREAVWNRLFPAWKRATKPVIEDAELAYALEHRIRSAAGLLAKGFIYQGAKDATKDLRRLKAEAYRSVLDLRFEREVLRGGFTHSGGFYSVDTELVERYLPDQKSRHRVAENPTP